MWWVREPYGRYTDVLQGVCVFVYRRRWFPDLGFVENIPPECYKSDDIWFSGNMRFHVPTVGRVLIRGHWFSGIFRLLGWGHTIEPDDLPAPPQSAGSRLSMGSTKHDRLTRDAKCIRAIEERFGSTWIPVRSNPL